MRGKGTWRVREIWESMGMVMLVVSVVFLTALAAIDSDCKLPSSHLGNAGPFYLQKTLKHKAAQLWNQCKKEFLEISEDGPSYLDVRFPTPSQGNHSFIQSYYTLLAKRSLWDAVSYLFSREQHIHMDNSILHGLLKDDDVSGAGMIKYKDFLSTLSRVPRRSLRFKKYKRVDTESDQAHSPAPSPEHAAESPVSDQGSSEEAADVGSHSSDSSSSEPKSESEEEPNETPNSLIAARKTKKAASSSSGNEGSTLIVVAVAGVTFAALLIVVVIFLVCSVKEMDDNDGSKDEKPLINVAPADIPAAAEADSPENPENPESTEDPGNNDSQSLPIVDNLPVATETETSSETNTMATEATEATEVAPVISQAALPLPPGKSPPPSPPTSPSPPPPEPSKPPEPQSGPPEPQSGPPVPTVPPVPAGPPAPKPPAPNCPPPPKGARPPPPPKLGGGPKCAPPPGPNHKGHNSGSEGTEAGESPKAKLKPFFWDKVNASPNTSMVWHEIRGGSFQFNEDLMESLFGYSPADQNKNDRKKESAKASSQFIQIIDAKKAQNLAILLKALNVTTEEVCDALKEGNELPHELVQTLLKMAPTADEELKLRLYTGDIALLGPADRFLKILIEIPFAFKRMESLLFMSILQEEIAYIKESFTTLEVACNELKNSRLFLKLLEAVLKTGNRMNTGTYRGGAQAIKLDTLLKLSDVKGTDGKTTLLHFVVQEIIRSEGLRAARALKESFSMTSVRTEDLVRDAPHDSVEYHRNLGLKVVSQLGDELKHVKKAAVIEGDNLTQTVAKLGHSLLKSKDFLNKDMASLEGDEFGITLTSFVEHAEAEIPTLLTEEHRIMALVKSTGDYFHGKSGKDEGLRLFIIVRDFLVMLDKVCKEVEKEAKAQQQQVKAPKKETPPIPLPSSGSSQEPQPPSSSQEPQPPSSSQEPEQSSSSQEPEQPSSSQEPQPESLIDMRQRLFPAIQARQMDDDDFSSDDESTDSS
ncbi:PREDICTED: formin-like protein 3 [Ipomoea nil]|uniref:formin-like protein 3 n=1 Tax=Ipomoea nil TaxID=35883 RepID=UPI00090095E4|nr:PREDICTED: formin-like protein 3 [Ipomoea nil]